MRISHRYRFVFFSNPKTGSESARQLLDPYSDVRGVPYWERSEAQPFYTHMRPVEARGLFVERGWDFDAYFKFTFVRNPWARLVSLYEMIYGRSRRPGTRARVLATLRHALDLHPSPGGFRRWIRAVRAMGRGAGGPPDQRWRVYGAYSLDNYVGDEERRSLVDEVVKLEDVDVKLPEVLVRIGIPDAVSLEVPRVNVRRHSRYTDYYDSDTVELVRGRYAYEIERFAYEFGA